MLRASGNLAVGPRLCPNVCRERIEARDTVGRYANDRRPGGGEFVFLLRECMSLEIAALGKRGWIEIDDDRTCFQSGFK
jgi:hypothetical protein